MSKSLQLLKELLQEDKIDTKEALEVLGFEIVESEEVDVYKNNSDKFGNSKFGSDILIGYDETYTIRKEHR